MRHPWKSAGSVQGLVITSYDGRPIKVEGNPGHPLSMGATDLYAQASVLGVYDPDRARGVTQKGAASEWGASTWADFATRTKYVAADAHGPVHFKRSLGQPERTRT